MKVIEWLNTIIDDGLLCEKYTKRVREAKSKKDLFDLVCDANGVSFLPEMREKGHGLDYEIIKDEFKNFINGRYIAEFDTTVGRYTSALYCGVRHNITIDTTLACLCDCKCDIVLSPYSIVTLCVDQNSDVNIFVPDNSICYVDDWGKVLGHSKGDNFRYRNMREEKK